MIHPSSHWLKNAAATNEHVAIYTRLYLHLKAQRSVLESIQSQVLIKLEHVLHIKETTLSSENNENVKNEINYEDKDTNAISADEITLTNCLSSIDAILKSDIKTAIFEASNFIMKTKDFPLSQNSPETFKLVNIFATSCVALIKFPAALLASFSEMNKQNMLSYKISRKNSNNRSNNIKIKKEPTILDSPIRPYIKNASSSEDYDYSVEESDDSNYSTYSIDNNEINIIDKSNDSYVNPNNKNTIENININTHIEDNHGNDNAENSNSNHESNNPSTNSGNTNTDNTIINNNDKNNNNSNDNDSNDNHNHVIANPRKRNQRSSSHKKKGSKKAPSTVICRLCNEPIPIDLFAEHIKSCAIAFKSELKVQDVNQMLLQQYDAIGIQFISSPWPGERQKAVDVTLPMLHLSILVMRAHDIEENTNDSLEELENIESSILHIPIAEECNNNNDGNQKNEKVSKLYRNVSNYNNSKIGPSKNRYKHINLKPVVSGLLNNISKRKVRNIPIKKSKDAKTSSIDETSNDTAMSDSEFLNNNNDNTNSNNNTYSSNSNNNSDTNSDYSSNNSKRNSIDLTTSNPIFKYINDSLKLLREKINLTVVLCAASDILRNTRLSGSDKIITYSLVKITNFEFIKLISAGAYARVFLAKMKTTGDVCAVKVTPKSSCTHKNEVLQLLTEKNIMLKFNNPYIVTFYCSFIGLNNLYLCMEYLPGGDLYSLLQNIGSFDEDTAKLYTYEIVLALKYLHTNGIIHRDLKPDNILISKEGKIKLTDFGLSHLGLIDRRNNEEPVEAEETKIIGTPDYIAPEILLEKKHTYTCDYWSLGCMVYEFLIGIPPFHADTEEETFKNILRGQYDLSSEVGIEDFSEEAVDFIKALLVTDPTKRLGANGIDEIMNHPWFEGVDPDKDEPPFIPELNSVYDTDYFKQRYQFKDDDSDIIEDINDEIEREKEKEKEDKLSQNSSISSQNLLPIGSSSSEISVAQHKDKTSSEIISDTTSSISGNVSSNISTSSILDNNNNSIVITDSDKFDYLTNENYSHSGVINIDNNNNQAVPAQPTDSPLVPLSTSFSSNVLKNYASVGVEQIIRRNEEILSYAQKQQEQERQSQQNQQEQKEEEPPTLEKRSNTKRAKYLAQKKPASFDLGIDKSDVDILTEYYKMINNKGEENNNDVKNNQDQRHESEQSPKVNDEDDNRLLKKAIKASSSEQKLLPLVDFSETEPAFVINHPNHNLSIIPPVHNSSLNSPIQSPIVNSNSPTHISNSASAKQITTSPSLPTTPQTVNSTSMIEIPNSTNLNNNSDSTKPIPNLSSISPNNNSNNSIPNTSNENIQSSQNIIQTVKNEIRKVSYSSSHPVHTNNNSLLHSISCSGSDQFETSDLVKTMILSQFSSSPVSAFLGVNEITQASMAKVSKSTKNFIQQSNSSPETSYDSNHHNDAHVTSSGSSNSNSSNSGHTYDPLSAFSDAILKSKKPLVILDSPYTMKRMRNWKEDPRTVFRRIRAKHRKNVKKLSSMLYHHHIHNV